MSNPAPIYPYTNTPAPVDLTTLAAVKDYLAQDQGAVIAPGADTADDLKIQAIITGCSQMWLTKTGRASLNSVGTYSEFYDGNGSIRLFLDNYPVVSVTNLQVNNQTIPQSTAVGVGGWFIERPGRSIAIRPRGAGGLQTTLGYPCGWQYQFTMGIGNVLVQYTGGFDGIPNDIFEAVTWQVAQSYKKREAINVDSQNMGGGAGSVTYSKWDWTPEIKQLLRDYTKIVVSGT